MQTYRAPWSLSLVLVSALASLLCAGIAGWLAWRGHGALPWVGTLPMLLLLGGALFTIRGYTLRTDALLIHRLLWTTRIPLQGLQSAAFEPDAMRGSLRTFGNGGLFSFTGLFWNRRLGSYRAFVTHERRTVVLRWARHVIVVSPHAPEDFVRDLAAWTRGKS